MLIADNNSRVASSFRDPSGFVFKKDGVIHRQVNNSYKENYDLLISSHLFDDLVKNGLMVNHEEVTNGAGGTGGVEYKIIKPDQIPFVSYPYEWSFSELKDAALVTLNVQKMALSHGMILKDASAYNIQFLNGRPVFIDTLSFEKYAVGRPWVAYKQFCQHFLAPLALMSFTDIRLSQLLRVFIDGVPLDLASRLLPKNTYLKFAHLVHIHMHAKSQAKYADQAPKKEIKIHGFSMNSMLGLIDNLESAIKKLNLRKQTTEWGNYYSDTNYSDRSFEAKKDIISRYLSVCLPKRLWDIGSNTGVFTRVAMAKGIDTVSFDIDPVAVELNYNECRKKNEEAILPLVLDLTNPSPSIGWQNSERDSLINRGPVDAVMALALIHHLAISNNVPLISIAEFFAKLCKYLIIEFVPKTDSQVKRLLASRVDIFPDYKTSGFEEAFGKYFKILEITQVGDSERSMYLMVKTR